MYKLAIGLLLAWAAQAGANSDLEAQRQLFQATYREIERGHASDLARVRERLHGYVLTPYLEYAYLIRNLRRVQGARVEAFLEHHGELPVAGGLRRAWQEELGRRGAWRSFLLSYQGGGGAELDCYQLRARQALEGTNADWYSQARRLWTVGRSQPNACDPVFAVLYRERRLDEDTIWRRAELAMEAGETDLARYLAGKLGAERRLWLQRWLQLDADPVRWLRAPQFVGSGERARQLVAHGLRRLSRSSPGVALELLGGYAERGLYEAREAHSLQRELSLWGAYSHYPEALGWLESLPAAAVDDQVRLWRAKLALAKQDWSRLELNIEALPAHERTDPEWRYWYAYALDKLGRREEALAGMRVLAEERHYYGFLAADALGQAYRMNAEPLDFDGDALERLAQLPALQRARELHAVGHAVAARREWDAAVAGLARTEQAKAAVLAAHWGWYDRAIVTANWAGLENALHLRFPTAFRDQVEHYSHKHRLDPSLTFALLRKESAFRPDAVSSAGAMGLMQVMPQTGRQMARLQDSRLRSSRALLDPETNLDLGGAYLRTVLDRFDGNVILAAAAYNAGPRRVDEWLSRYADLPPEIWIETISFRETRDYVKSILAFRAVFDWQLRRESRPLTGLLQPISQAAGCGEAGC